METIGGAPSAPTRSRWKTRVLLGLLALGLAGAPAHADAPQAPADTFAAGQVIASVASRADTTNRYALYLPRRYDTGRRWPVLLVLDPRGRALHAMERFADAAERDGYVVMSSYNTVSDSTEEPNRRALNAMLADAEQRFAGDPGRIYLAGFSGTARLAWLYASVLSGHVKGILGFAAGLPWRGLDAYVALKKAPPFAFFGGAGMLDFNYDEVRLLDAMLDSLTHQPHRLEYFVGPHGWPPEAICGDAIDWMELQAVKDSAVLRNDSLISIWYTRRLDAAKRLEMSGDMYEAWRRYQATQEDFRGVRGIEEATTKVAALSSLPIVRQSSAREDDLGKSLDEYRTGVLRSFVSDFQAAKQPPPLARALKDLRIADLQRHAADSTRDRLAALEAQRALILVRVTTGYYEPRAYQARGDFTRALAMLAVAHALDPADPDVCYEIAEAEASTGRVSEAIESLRCAAARGGLTADVVRGDHAFDAIRGIPAFASLVQSLAIGDHAGPTP